MSTDWGIGCRDCAPPRDEHGFRPRPWPLGEKLYFSGEWDNCRDIGALKTICAAADEILAADGKLGQYLIVTWSGDALSGSECRGIAAFMHLHRGHRLAPMSEYRMFHDESYP